MKSSALERHAVAGRAAFPIEATRRPPTAGERAVAADDRLRAEGLLELWDGGRLLVHRDYAELLRSHGLTTFEALWRGVGETLTKNAVRERTTSRFVLDSATGETAFYIKRHYPASWKERIKPWLHGRRPILGARAEWDALWWFHELGIPTMQPVAYGAADSRSLLVTEALPPGRKVAHLLREGIAAGDPLRKRLLQTVARLARRMHAAGLHHQDFYATHLLVAAGPGDRRVDEPERVYVLDLGRVCRRRQLALRWIVKDLAQLYHSTPQCSRLERLRFLRSYLGRPLSAADRKLMARIERKARRIARHTARHRL